MQIFIFEQIFKDLNLNGKKFVKNSKTKSRVNFKTLNANLTTSNLLRAARTFTIYFFLFTQYMFQISSKSEYDRKVCFLVRQFFFLIVSCPKKLCLDTKWTQIFQWRSFSPNQNAWSLSTHCLECQLTQEQFWFLHSNAISNRNNKSLSRL